MKRETYDSVLAEIDRQIAGEWDLCATIEDIINKFPGEKPHALRSILSHKIQRIVKKTYYNKTSDGKRDWLFRRYRQLSKDPKVEVGTAIVSISRAFRFPPALTAKLIVEEIYNRKNPEGAKLQKKELSALLKHPESIEDPRLAEELHSCYLEDDHYGNYAELIKQAVGRECEELLKRHLDELGCQYHDEEYFREKGYDKTPDIKFEVPIVVNGVVVNWIESKGLFGDDEGHKRYLKDQLWSYWNRFGPGMVIYWAGYIDDLNQTEKHSGIQLSDGFPSRDKIVLSDTRKEIDKIFDKIDRISDEEDNDESQPEDRLQNVLKELDLNVHRDIGGLQSGDSTERVPKEQIRTSEKPKSRSEFESQVGKLIDEWVYIGKKLKAEKEEERRRYKVGQRRVQLTRVVKVEPYNETEHTKEEFGFTEISFQESPPKPPKTKEEELKEIAAALGARPKLELRLNQKNKKNRKKNLNNKNNGSATTPTDNN